MLDIIRSMYTEIKSQVKHNNIISPVFFSNIGVRQGECLSPFLFSIYLNDLEEEITLKGADGIDMEWLSCFYYYTRTTLYFLHILLMNYKVY